MEVGCVRLTARHQLHNAKIAGALEGGDGPSNAMRRRGRPSGSTNKPAATGRKRRSMSAAARKRIADAMKARWAAAKKSGKKRL